MQKINYLNILNKIQESRSLSDFKQHVEFIAVSKTQPSTAVEQLYQFGQRNFGENYLQEAIAKQRQLSHLKDIIWHFIGSIQSNKASLLAEKFHWIHTVDRLKIAQILNKKRSEIKLPINICIQVNTSYEDSKSGVSPKQVSDLIDNILPLPYISLRGLMCIPKLIENNHEQSNGFKMLRELMFKLNQKHNIQMNTLSMGMSQDFIQAIEQGATMVRIGTAIFGTRKSKVKV